MNESEKTPPSIGINAAGSPQQQLARERDRLKLLLDINNAVSRISIWTNSCT
ncbi:MAG: hypothetical protein AABN33_24195 [Acidobacteriota bacterium]